MGEDGLPPPRGPDPPERLEKAGKALGGNARAESFTAQLDSPQNTGSDNGDQAPPPPLTPHASIPTGNDESQKERETADPTAVSEVQDTKPANSLIKPGKTVIEAKQHGATKIWSKTGAQELRQKLQGVKEQPRSQLQPIMVPQTTARPTPVPPKLEAELYACATAAYNLRQDGHQREMTPMEWKTLHQWTLNKLHVQEPPAFVQETMVSAERDVLEVFSDNHLGFRLYVQLPVGASLPNKHTKYHLKMELHKASGTDAAATALVQELLDTASSITCEAKAQLVCFRFTYPQHRDYFKNKKIKYGNASVTLTATDSLTSPYVELGFDKDAQVLLYKIFLLGGEQLEPSTIRSLVETATGSRPLEVKKRRAVPGDNGEDTWEIMFCTTGCPDKLKNVRQWKINNGRQPVELLRVHHPRHAYRHPCTKCLSVYHSAKDCKTKDYAAASNKRTVTVDLPTGNEAPRMPLAKKQTSYEKKMKNMRTVLAPELAAAIKKKQENIEAKRARTEAKKAAKEAARTAREVQETQRVQRAARETTLKALRRQETKVQKQLIAERAAHFLKERQKQATEKKKAAETDKTQKESHTKDSGKKESHAKDMENKESVNKSEQQAEQQEQGAGTVNEGTGTGTAAATKEQDAPAIEQRGFFSSLQEAVAKAVEEAGHQQHHEDPGEGEQTASTATTRRKLDFDSVSSTEIVLYDREDMESVGDTSMHGGSAGDTENEEEIDWDEEMNQAEDPRALITVNSRCNKSGHALLSYQLQQRATEAEKASELSGVTQEEPETETDADRTKIRRALNQTDVRAPKKPEDPFTTFIRVAGTEQRARVFDQRKQELTAEGVAAQVAKRVIQKAVTSYFDPKLPSPEITDPTPPLSSLFSPSSQIQCSSGSQSEPHQLSVHYALSPTPTLPRTLPEWTEVLGAKLVQILGNGACFFIALHAAQYANVKGNITTLSRLHNWGATYYIKLVWRSMHNNIEKMVAEGTVDYTRVYQRYTKNSVIPDKATAVAELKELFLKASKRKAKQGMPTNLYAGSYELAAAAEELGELIFVGSVGAEGQVHFEVYYHAQNQTDTGEREESKNYVLTAEEAYAMIGGCLEAQAIPIILTYHPIGDVGHYNCLRLPQACYDQWAPTIVGKPSMRERLVRAMATRGHFIAPPHSHEHYVELAREIPSSASEYTPSASCSEEGTTSPEKATDQLHETITLAERRHLGDDLHGRQRSRSDRAALWARAERADKAAAEIMTAGMPAASGRSKGGSFFASLCWQRINNIDEVIHLLRGIPTPEVELSLLPMALKLEVGHELILRTRQRQLLLWESAAPTEEAQNHFQQWHHEMEGTDDPAQRWASSQNELHWMKADELMGWPIYGQRLLDEVIEEDWIHLVLALVVLNPLQASTEELGVAAQAWIARHRSKARDLIKALNEHRWTPLLDMFFTTSTVSSTEPQPSPEGTEAARGELTDRRKENATPTEQQTRDGQQGLAGNTDNTFENNNDKNTNNNNKNNTININNENNENNDNNDNNKAPHNMRQQKTAAGGNTAKGPAQQAGRRAATRGDPVEIETEETKETRGATETTETVETAAATRRTRFDYRGHKTNTLRAHFTQIGRKEYNKATARAFADLQRLAAHKDRRREAQRKRRTEDEVTWATRSQNVQGLRKTTASIERWFTALRTRTQRGQAALTLVQETHVKHGERERMRAKYRAAWGFTNHGQELSYWTETDTREGGVGILLNPYMVHTAAPAMTHRWSKNFMAVVVEVEDQSILVINIYAPHDTATREAFYATLATDKITHSGPIIMGGDFNCTQNWELDRSHAATAHRHVSAGLSDLLEQWQLVDPLLAEFGDEVSEEEKEQFHAQQHTYEYSFGEIHASSRLDRWYITARHIEWVRQVEVEHLGVGSDHAAVVMNIGDPAHRRRAKPRQRIYPPKRCATEAVTELIETELATLQLEMEEMNDRHAEADAILTKWEFFKTELASKIRHTTKAAVTKTNAGFRQKLRRLRQRLKNSHGSQHNDVDAAERRQLIADITVNVARWQALKQRKQSGHQGWLRERDMKAFYGRVSTRVADTTIANIAATPGFPERTATDVANSMADGWHATLNQVHTARNEPGQDFAIGGMPIDEDRALEMDMDFTETEIERAIKRCHRGKSGGPDKLPNAWYRDFAAELVPLLCIVLNAGLQSGRSPASFKEAHIICLPKAGRSTNALQYRPIALLNSDYKVYMRLLAARCKPILGDIVHGVQHGFVPGRNIHHAIDTFTAFQAMARRDGTGTVAVLLDIKKAYDSLDRHFLFRCLRERGFPPRYCQVMEDAHTGTTAKFQVNGFLSRQIPVTCGIRQGCPLAPLLFIIVMDALYRRLLADPRLHITSTIGAQPVPTVSGFADDTAVYLSNEHKIPVLLEHLRCFAISSGLTINENKSVVVRLAAVAGPVKNSYGLRGQDVDAACRYLGVLVGTNVGDETVWSTMLTQLTRRLYLAQRKTHSVRERATIAKAIIIPKILFVARHHWPTAPQATDWDTRIRAFVWSGIFATRQDQADGTERRRPWISMELAKLPVKEGGMGVPCIRSELREMATLLVADWAYADLPARRAVVELMGWRHATEYLQAPVTATPSDKRVQWTSSMWAVGEAHFTQLHEQVRSQGLHISIVDGLQVLQTMARGKRVWVDEACIRDYNGFYAAGGLDLQRQLVRAHGNLRREWIPYVRLNSSSSSLLRNDGSRWTTAALKGLGQGDHVHNYVSWTCLRPNVIKFNPQPGVYPFATDELAHTFVEFCDALVGNFPGIIGRPDVATTIGTYDGEEEEGYRWQLDPTAKAYELKTLQGTQTIATRTVTSQRDLLRPPLIATSDGPRRPRFTSAPCWTRLVTPWAGQAPWSPSRRCTRRMIRSSSAAAGATAREAKETALTEDDTDMATILQTIKWRDIATVPGLDTYDRQFWHRVKHGELRTWNAANNSSNCPRATCTEKQGSQYHVLWACPHAQSMWKRVASHWGAAALSEDDLKNAVMGMRPPTSCNDWVSAALAKAPDHRDADEIRERAPYWLQVAWRQLTTVAARKLWGEHTDEMFNRGLNIPSNTATGGFHTAAHAWQQRLRGTLAHMTTTPHATSRADRLIQQTLCRGFLTDTADRPKYSVTSGAPEYILFFDGGSRGNPGPGGSGAVVVQLGRDADSSALIWAASMSSARTSTTNNTAEYTGLSIGLHAAKANGWHPLTVVGDSKLILTHMRDKAPPRKSVLRRLYQEALRHTDGLYVRAWIHHYREYNKMADNAANIAMDTRRSIQSHSTDGRSDHVGIEHWMANDVEHFLRNRNAGLTSNRPAKHRPV